MPPNSVITYTASRSEEPTIRSKAMVPLRRRMMNSTRYFFSNG